MSRNQGYRKNGVVPQSIQDGRKSTTDILNAFSSSESRRDDDSDCESIELGKEGTVFRPRKVTWVFVRTREQVEQLLTALEGNCTISFVLADHDGFREVRCGVFTEIKDTLKTHIKDFSGAYTEQTINVPIRDCNRIPLEKVDFDEFKKLLKNGHSTLRVHLRVNEFVGMVTNRFMFASPSLIEGIVKPLFQTIATTELLNNWETDFALHMRRSNLSRHRR